MELQLSNFKQVLPKEILQRGKNYYNNGQVIELSMDNEGEWEAQVEGTEVYDVSIVQDAGGGVSCRCTCPYEYGIVCKHIAAVLYAIEESFPEYVGTSSKKGEAKSKKKPTRIEQLEAALRKASHDDLLKLILNLATQDKNLLNSLLIQVGVTDNDPASYARLVKNAIRAGKGDDGYVDYRGAYTVAREIDKLFTQAQHLVEREQYQQAIFIYQAVIDHVMDSYNSMDDSSGSVGGCISDAIEGLRDVAELANPAERYRIFTYCLTQGQQKQWQGFDWQWDFFDIASELVDSPSGREQLFQALEGESVSRKSAAGFSSRFSREQVAYVKLNIIRKLDGAQAAEDFITQNLDLDGFRQQRIEALIANGDFGQAKHLAEQGMTTSERENLPGLTAQYRKRLLDIAEKQGDSAVIIRIARECLLNETHPLNGETVFKEYYERLKQHVPVHEWDAFIKQLLRDLPRDSYRQPSLKAQIYSREGMWEELLALIQHGEIKLLERYRIELESRFPTALVELYKQQVYKILEYASNRDTYQIACEYLSRMKALGQVFLVKGIIDELTIKYKSRRALLEELRKV